MSRMLDLTSEEYGRIAAQNKVSENFENLIPECQCGCGNETQACIDIK